MKNKSTIGLAKYLRRVFRLFSKCPPKRITKFLQLIQVCFELQKYFTRTKINVYNNNANNAFKFYNSFISGYSQIIKESPLVFNT